MYWKNKQLGSGLEKSQWGAMDNTLTLPEKQSKLLWNKWSLQCIIMERWKYARNRRTTAWDCW